MVRLRIRTGEDDVLRDLRVNGQPGRISGVGTTVHAAVDERLAPDAEADAIIRIMSTAYEEESWRRVMNASMVAAGALVVRNWLADSAFRLLYRPFAAAIRVETLKVKPTRWPRP